MKNIKLKLLSFLVCFVMCFSLVGCGDKSNNNNNGGGNGGGGSSTLTAEQVLTQAKDNFLNKKAFEVSISKTPAGSQTSTTSKTQVKIAETYLYVNQTTGTISTAKTYEKVSGVNGDSYTVKNYDLSEKTYTETEISEESYYQAIYNNFAVTDWLGLYNSYLKSDDSTISVSQNGTTFTVILTRSSQNDSGELEKEKITLTASNGSISTLKIETYSSAEVLQNTTTASFNYNVTIDFNITDYTLYEEPVVEQVKTTEQLLDDAKNSYLASDFSAYIYKIESDEEVEIKTVNVKSSSNSQYVKTEEGKVTFIQMLSVNSVTQREYNLTEMTYTQATHPVSQAYYNFIVGNYSIIDWSDYVSYMQNTMNYTVTTESEKLENDEFDYQVTLTFTKGTTEVIEYNLYMKDGKVLEISYVRDFNIIVGTSPINEYDEIFVTLTYDIEDADLSIEHSDFTLA